MKIIAADNEIIVRQGEDKNAYYNVNGPLKGVKKKAKKLVGSGKVQGFFGKAQGVLGALGVGQGGGTQVDLAPPPPPKKSMSTAMKVGIGVGVAAVLGIIIYVATKKKK